VVTITSGTTTDGGSGEVTLQTSNAAGTDRSAGDILIATGTGTGAGTSGEIRFSIGGTQKVIITSDGDVTFAGSTIVQNSQSAAYTTVAADANKHILHPSADTTARTFTIDSNANVPYRIGTAITFVNQNAAGVLTIAITSDTMRLAGAGTTGSRTLAANGVATALKITATEWIISGTGLT
jgi:hypothetical protein